MTAAFPAGVLLVAGLLVGCNGRVISLIAWIDACNGRQPAVDRTLEDNKWQKPMLPQASFSTFLFAIQFAHSLCLQMRILYAGCS